ncbi:MAG: hypothetical protein ACO4AJ_10280 [Prochlorothrix sp.]
MLNAWWRTGRADQPAASHALFFAAPSLTPDSLKAELTALLAQGLSRSQASRQLAKVTPFTRQELYQLALTLSPEADGQELTDRS